LNLRGSRPFLLMSGPKAVARLSQGIRPSTALRPLAGPRACGGMCSFPANPDRRRHVWGLQAPRQRQRLQVLRFSNLGRGTRRGPIRKEAQRDKTLHQLAETRGLLGIAEPRPHADRDPAVGRRWRRHPSRRRAAAPARSAPRSCDRGIGCRRIARAWGTQAPRQRQPAFKLCVFFSPALAPASVDGSRRAPRRI